MKIKILIGIGGLSISVFAVPITVVNGNAPGAAGWTISGSVDVLSPGAFWLPPTTGSGTVDLDGSAPTGAIEQALSIGAAGTATVNFALTGNFYGGPTI